jgi:dihydrodipicolinate synthase/N-acetylneuraminate lyase
MEGIRAITAMMSTKTIIDTIKPNRRIEGISSMLLPFTPSGAVDWDGFCAHVARTDGAGLIPAVNMDTGYVNLLDETSRTEVLHRTRETLGVHPFAAGAFVCDEPGENFSLTSYLRQIEQIQSFGGVPVIFPSFGLTGLSPDALLTAYGKIGRHAPRFIAFELGAMFATFGTIYPLETYEGLLNIRECIGAKHSSLSRRLEWQRLALRDRIRPDFKVYTGNEMAIDMVMYGSDYLLGLSTFAPDFFALRDRFWLEGNPAFYELNDFLQHLGFFAFRSPLPAYKHNAAQFLRLRDWIGCDDTHPRSPRRPASDIEILRKILERLEIFR